jgi:hypothetical protein
MRNLEMNLGIIEESDAKVSPRGLLPLGKQRDTFGADDARRFPIPQRLENPLELRGVSPDLPGAYTLTAFTQCLERVGPTNDTLGHHPLLIR